MRSNQEMMNMLVDFAKNENRIRLAILEGSRKNKNIPRDRFQDYDEAITKYTQNIYDCLNE